MIIRFSTGLTLSFPALKCFILCNTLIFYMFFGSFGWVQWLRTHPTALFLPHLHLFTSLHIRYPSFIPFSSHILVLLFIFSLSFFPSLSVSYFLNLSSISFFTILFLNIYLHDFQVIFAMISGIIGHNFILKDFGFNHIASHFDVYFLISSLCF